MYSNSANLPNGTMTTKGFRIGDILITEEIVTEITDEGDKYDMIIQTADQVGKLVDFNLPCEALLDLIDVDYEDIIFCDIRKCRKATQEEINNVFNT